MSGFCGGKLDGREAGREALGAPLGAYKVVQLPLFEFHPSLCVKKNVSS